MNNLSVIEESTATGLEKLRENIWKIDTVEETVNYVSQIDAIRTVMVKLKKATEDRLAALRLELALMRRLGQLDGLDGLGVTATQKKHMCREMAKLSDGEFESLLARIDSEDANFAAITVWRSIRPETDEERAQRERAERRLEQHRSRLLEDGDYAADYDAEIQASEVSYRGLEKSKAIADAVGVLIDELDLESEPFSTRELQRKVRNEFVKHTMDEYEWADDPELGALIEKVVYKGVRESAIVDGDLVRLTYYDIEVGWVRVPFAVASVKHLRAYSDYAQQQADTLQAKADKLRSHLARYVGLMGDGDSDTVKLTELEMRED